jgi:hypothetical protein
MGGRSRAKKAKGGVMIALDISWIDESFREMKEKIAKLEAKNERLEHEITTTRGL